MRDQWRRYVAMAMVDLKDAQQGSRDAAPMYLGQAWENIERAIESVELEIEQEKEEEINGNGPCGGG
jgi:hypothetical protein